MPFSNVGFSSSAINGSQARTKPLVGIKMRCVFTVRNQIEITDKIFRRQDKKDGESKVRVRLNLADTKPAQMTFTFGNA